MIKLVYIAGPFRGPTDWDIAENVRNAERTALVVAKADAMPVCPHANTQHFQGQKDDNFWLEGDIELLSRCDAIFTVPGWEKSDGAKKEVKKAKELFKPVFHNIRDLEDWLRYSSLIESRETRTSSMSVIYTQIYGGQSAEENKGNSNKSRRRQNSKRQSRGCDSLNTGVIGR